MCSPFCCIIVSLLLPLLLLPRCARLLLHRQCSSN
jgi:hypothetical protein